VTDLDLLCDAARASGDIAKRFFNASPETWDKGDDAGPVTEADLAIDKMLHAELLSNRPDYGWLSEETEDDLARLDHRDVFIIDPIDGTRAFIAGEKSFSHSLAIARDGIVVAAAVYVPMMDLLFAASADTQTQLNGEPARVSARREVDGATVLAAKPNFFPEHWIAEVPPVKRKFRPSLAYRLSLVAQGRYDAMLTVRDSWEWDIAAGALLVERAGGTVTDRLGQPLRFNAKHPKTKGCHAANPAVHQALQSQLKPQ